MADIPCIYCAGSFDSLISCPIVRTTSISACVCYGTELVGISTVTERCIYLDSGTPLLCFDHSTLRYIADKTNFTVLYHRWSFQLATRVYCSLNCLQCWACDRIVVGNAARWIIAHNLKPLVCLSVCPCTCTLQCI